MFKFFMVRAKVALPQKRRIIGRRGSIALLALLVSNPLGFPPALASPVDALLAEITGIEAELETLPKTPVSGNPWTIGYAAERNYPKQPSHIEIHFHESALIDLVVIMPATYRNDTNELRPFGFPVRFMLEQLFPDGSTEMIVDHRDSDYHCTGIEPQLFPCSSSRPSTGLRITATQLATNPLWWPYSHTIAMSEVFVFSGERNVALNATVKAWEPKVFGYAWNPKALVDGFSLFYQVDRAVRNPLEDFHTFSDQVVLIYDLGEEVRVDELRLWPVVYCTQENFPPASGTSFPTDIRLDKLENPDESGDFQVLYQSDRQFPKPGSNPFMHRIAPIQGRYFRLTLSKGLPDFRINRSPRIALSEFELLENGHVLTRGLEAKVRILDRHQTTSPTLQQESSITLTDGRTNEGEILPLREWIVQFKQQAAMERRLAVLKIDLEFARRLERGRFIFFAYAGITLIAILVLMVLLVRLLSQRRWDRIREQIACDLHDDIGGNMSSVAHSVELARETMENPTNQQIKWMDNAIRIARLTAQETRQIVQFLEQKKTSGSLSIHIEKVASLILGDIKLSCSFDKAQPFLRLPPSRKWDLLLFVKEALNNVVKHAEATQVDIVTQNDTGRPQLIIADNGRGISETDPPLRHLIKRAQRLNGSLEVNTNSKTGTRITLTLRKRG